MRPRAMAYFSPTYDIVVSPDKRLRFDDTIDIDIASVDLFYCILQHEQKIRADKGSEDDVFGTCWRIQLRVSDLVTIDTISVMSGSPSVEE